MSEDISEYDPEKLRSRDEMKENIDGLLAIMREEVAFLETVRDRLDEGEEMEAIFADFLKESRLDDIDDYLTSL